MSTVAKFIVLTWGGYTVVDSGIELSYSRATRLHKHPFPTFPLSFSLDLPFPAYINRISTCLPLPFSLEKYLPSSVSLSLWIYLFQPTWTEISTFLSLPFSLDLPFPAYMDRNVTCLPTLPHSFSIFPSMDRNIYLPPSFPMLPLPISLDLPLPAYIGSNFYLFPSPFLSGFTCPSLHGQK